MSDDSNQSGSAPVYVPWATFVSAIENLRVNGIPGTGKLDKSLWDTQSGAVQGQIVIAFRFLGLIDSKNQVLSSLPELVKAGPDQRKAILTRIIEDKYRKALSNDLTTISTGQLQEAFKTFDISGSTLDRAIRFFVRACQEVGDSNLKTSVRQGALNPCRKTQPAFQRG